MEGEVPHGASAGNEGIRGRFMQQSINRFAYTPASFRRVHRNAVLAIFSRSVVSYAYGFTVVLLRLAW